VFLGYLCKLVAKETRTVGSGEAATTVPSTTQDLSKYIQQFNKICTGIEIRCKGYTLLLLEHATGLHFS